MFLSPQETRDMLGKKPKHEKKESSVKEKKEHMAKKINHGSQKFSKKDKAEMLEDKLRGDYGRGEM